MGILDSLDGRTHIDIKSELQYEMDYMGYHIFLICIYTSAYDLNALLFSLCLSLCVCTESNLISLE